MYKKRYLDKKIMIFIILSTIGITTFVSGWLYIIITGGISIVEKPYTVSIPRKYRGELELLASGRERLSIESILNVSDFKLRGGIQEEVSTFSITNKSYVLATVKLRGKALNSSSISLLIQIYDAESNELVNSGNAVNRSNIIDGEYLLISSLEPGKYMLKILSNSDTLIDYLILRGIYYDHTKTPALSIMFTPEEFYHHTLYYVDKIDVKNLWISIALIISGIIIMQIALIISTIFHRISNEVLIKSKKR